MPTFLAFHYLVKPRLLISRIFDSLAITDDILSEGPFLAYGSDPVPKGEKDALTRANNTYWPIILGWAQIAEDGTKASGDAVAMCVRAADGKNGTQTGNYGPDVGRENRKLQGRTVGGRNETRVTGA